MTTWLARVCAVGQNAATTAIAFAVYDGHGAGASARALKKRKQVFILIVDKTKGTEIQ